MTDVERKLALTLHVWRQKDGKAEGGFVRYPMKNVSTHMSFLEMLDLLNERLIGDGELPIAFDHDCREGICGTCGFMINGIAHGPRDLTTVCQLHMREFQDGDELWLEPFRAAAFPVVCDLVVDRSAFDRMIQAGGYVGIRTGSAPEANLIPIPKDTAELAFDAAACIGCGACVASCPNASASLFTAAKVSHLALIPQGHPERYERVRRMVAQHDDEGFGSCTLHRECEAVCPKGIRVENIMRMNRELLDAFRKARTHLAESGGD